MPNYKNTKILDGDNLVIVYFNFKNRDIELNNTSITIGSRFSSRGFKGLIGDFIVLNKNHTYTDYINIQNYLIKKYNITYIN